MLQKVAMVTGAGSGIGKATALAFLADGFRVVLAGRHRAEAVRQERQRRRLADARACARDDRYLL